MSITNQCWIIIIALSLVAGVIIFIICRNSIKRQNEAAKMQDKYYDAIEAITAYVAQNGGEVSASSDAVASTKEDVNKSEDKKDKKHGGK